MVVDVYFMDMDMCKLSLIVWSLSFIATVSGESQCMNISGSAHFTMEHDLLNNLLCGYDTRVRPAKTHREKVVVDLQLLVFQINGVDEKNHVLELNSWLELGWKDPRLVWNPTSYDNVSELQIPAKDVWIPDIILLNRVGDMFSPAQDPHITVTHAGYIVWEPFMQIRANCRLNLSRFPFDTQSCDLFFSSWSHELKYMDILPVKDYSAEERVTPNKEWHLEQMSSRRDEWQITAGVLYPVITYSLVLKRQSSFFQYLFVMPTVILAFLTLLIHFIPPESSERITMATGLLICCTLLLLLLEVHIPTDLGTVPAVASYLAFVFVELTVCILLSIIVCNYHYRDARRGKVPAWMRWMFLNTLARVVCVPQEPYTSVPAEVAVEESRAERELASLREGEVDVPAHTATSPSGRNVALENTLDEIRRYLRLLTARSALTEPLATHRELVVSEWHRVIRVIDRLMFFIFLILTIIITIAMYAHT